MTIFCGNLDSNLTDEDLRKAFEPYGQVDEAKVIYHYQSTKSRGFGFVKMSQPAALKAIEALNGTMLGERVLRLEEARPWVRNDRPPRPKTPEESIWR